MFRFVRVKFMTLVDMRRHSNVLHVRPFRAANCNTGQYLMVAKVKEKLALDKQSLQISYGEAKSQEVKLGRG
jgi:hypothetical protein